MTRNEMEANFRLIAADCVWSLHEPEFDPGPDCAGCKAAERIVKALRQAREEAIEEAAKAVDKSGYVTRDVIAENIRALAAGAC